MTNALISDRLKRFEIPDRIRILGGQGKLTKIEASSDWSTAEIYLHGAQVTAFQKKGEPPLLFMSERSRFAPDQAIRGGIPVIFPWFGPREGEPAHGFARLAEWELNEATTSPAGGVSLRLTLPGTEVGGTRPAFSANYVVTITDTLTLELILTNLSAKQDFTFENCLHTYFAVGDISAVSISGLKGVNYLDKVENFAQKTEKAEAISVTSEVDRVYFNSSETVEILDSNLRRKIRVEKNGSASTVVWNPWTAKARQMPDFDDEEYRQMVCVESGNVRTNKLVLASGKSSVLKVVLSSAAV